MIFIRANEAGKIDLVALQPFPYTFAYEGPVPADLWSTFADGKYLFLQGELQEVPDWVAPVQKLIVPKVTAFLIEETVSASRKLVCNLPVLTGTSSFVLDVTVLDQGMEERVVQLQCTNATTLPDGQGGQVPEFDYLVYALQNGANLFALTRQMLQLRNAQGLFD